MTIPTWLVKGTWIEFAFSVGRIVDIAESPERIMILVESPKGIWRNHPAEWIEYAQGAIQLATPERIARDFELYRAHLAQMLAALDAMELEAAAQTLFEMRQAG